MNVLNFFTLACYSLALFLPAILREPAESIPGWTTLLLGPLTFNLVLICAWMMNAPLIFCMAKGLTKKPFRNKILAFFMLVIASTVLLNHKMPRDEGTSTMTTLKPLAGAYVWVLSFAFNFFFSMQPDKKRKASP